MRHLSRLFIFALLSACAQKNTPNQDITTAVDSTQVVNEKMAVENQNTLVQAKKYRFLIPGEFCVALDGQFVDTNLVSNYLNLNNGQFIAKQYLIEDALYWAVQNKLDNQHCAMYDSHILTRDENGNFIDVFGDLMPDISLYSFYDFGDKQVSQLEGDEETFFAGYQYHFEKDDSLGVQFMFCNGRDSVDTYQLNENGKQLFLVF